MTMRKLCMALDSDPDIYYSILPPLKRFEIHILIICTEIYSNIMLIIFIRPQKSLFEHPQNYFLPPGACR